MTDSRGRPQPGDEWGAGPGTLGGWRMKVEQAPGPGGSLYGEEAATQGTLYTRTAYYSPLD